MDEERWLNGTDPHAMLDYLRGRVVERKLRLFACACVRQHWELLADVRSRRAVEVGELYADGLASEVERFDAWDEASEVPGKDALARAAVCVVEADNEHAEGDRALVDIVHEVVRELAIRIALPQAEYQARCAALLRCIFGARPFSTPPRVPDGIRLWGDRTVPRLARAIYEEHSFADLPVLADALEDAGCTDGPILDHLRRPGPHARGCFALDACLLP